MIKIPPIQPNRVELSQRISIRAVTTTISSIPYNSTRISMVRLVHTPPVDVKEATNSIRRPYSTFSSISPPASLKFVYVAGVPVKSMVVVPQASVAAVTVGRAGGGIAVVTS